MADLKLPPGATLVDASGPKLPPGATLVSDPSQVQAAGEKSGFFGRLGENASGLLNLGAGVATHPLDTAKAMLTPDPVVAKESADAFNRGDYGRAAGSLIEDIPVIGPQIRRTEQDVRKGDYGALAADTATALLLGKLPKLARKIPGVSRALEVAGEAAHDPLGLQHAEPAARAATLERMGVPPEAPTATPAASPGRAAPIARILIEKLAKKHPFIKGGMMAIDLAKAVGEIMDEPKAPEPPSAAPEASKPTAAAFDLEKWKQAKLDQRTPAPPGQPTPEMAQQAAVPFTPEEQALADHILAGVGPEQGGAMPNPEVSANSPDRPANPTPMGGADYAMPGPAGRPNVGDTRLATQPVLPPPTFPQPEAPLATEPPNPGQVGEMDPRSITADPGRFQFKPDGGDSRLEGPYDPERAGTLSVWRDPADGKTYITDGHNRLQLANQSAVRSVKVRSLDASDVSDLMGRLKVRQIQAEIDSAKAKIAAPPAVNPGPTVNPPAPGSTPAVRPAEPSAALGAFGVDEPLVLNRAKVKALAKDNGISEWDQLKMLRDQGIKIQDDPFMTGETQRNRRGKATSPEPMKPETKAPVTSEDVSVAPGETPYQKKIGDLGMKIRDGKPVTSADFQGLTKEDYVALRQLQVEYQPKPPAQPVEPPAVIREGRNGAQEVSGKFDYGVPDDDFLYHVTTKANAAKILKEGLIPDRGAPSMGDGFYRSYSKGKTFVSEKSGVPYWQNKISDHLNHQFDNPPKLTIIRFPRESLGELSTDELGARDSGNGSYYKSAETSPAKTPTAAETEAAIRKQKMTELGELLNRKSEAPAADVTPERTLYHGTAAPEFKAFKGMTYLTDKPVEASLYANGLPGAGARGGSPRVLHVKVGAGKTLNIAEAVENEIMDGGDIDKVIADKAKEAKAGGYRFLQFDHPGSKGGDIPVTVSLYPEDLSIQKSAKPSRSTKVAGGELGKLSKAQIDKLPAKQAVEYLRQTKR